MSTALMYTFPLCIYKAFCLWENGQQRALNSLTQK